MKEDFVVILLAEKPYLIAAKVASFLLQTLYHKNCANICKCYLTIYKMYVSIFINSFAMYLIIRNKPALCAASFVIMYKLLQKEDKRKKNRQFWVSQF